MNNSSGREHLEAAQDTLQGVACLLTALAQNGTEESGALALLAREVDDAYMEIQAAIEAEE